MATSLAGVSVAGTLLVRPTMPVRAMPSMCGLRAACSRVSPPSVSWGSSAQPSGMMIAYFMVSIRNRVIDGGRRRPLEPIDLRNGGAEAAGHRGVRHDDQRHGVSLLAIEGLVLDHGRDADLVPRQLAGDVGQHARP